MIPTSSLSDEFFMQRALNLAKQARVNAPPNPWVGCVIVLRGHIVGEGFTQPAGQPHAEIQALLQAKELAKGATLYVSLEPCAHHGRTPPCIEAILKAGIARVVVAILDPDERVRGQGLASLFRANIPFSFGVLAEAAKRLLEPYLFQRTFKRPFILAKAAISADGRCAAMDGSSKWISGPLARADVHQLRAESQAILVGKNTAIIDQPQLTVREGVLPTTPPLRVVLDSKGESKPLSQGAPTLLFTTGSCKNAHLFQKTQTEMITVPPAKNGVGVDLPSVFSCLYERGIIQVLAEGGSLLFNSLLKEHLINQLTLYLGPCLLGSLGKPLFSDLIVPSIEHKIPLQLKKVFPLEETIRIDYAF